MAVRYYLVNFVTGAVINQAPVMSGATWALTLNKADSLSCKINFRDPITRSIDPLSVTEPEKTAIVAVSDETVPIAWGIIDPTRGWDENTMTLSVTAAGGWSYFDGCIIGTSAAKMTAIVTTAGVANTALDRTFTGVSYATMGKRLMQDRLGWPGATMPFSFPADETVSGLTKTYTFYSMKTIGSALTDLVALNGGPDIDFGVAYAANNIDFTYPVRMGTNAAPQIGSYIGAWVANGEGSPLESLTWTDDFNDFATAAWATSTGTDSRGNSLPLASRVINDGLVAAGYPPKDYVDTSHSDVSVQATLDSYTTEDSIYASKYQRTYTFNVRSRYPDGSKVSPGLGSYRPGDYVDLDFIDHVALGNQTRSCRITAMSGDETGSVVKVSAQEVTS